MQERRPDWGDNWTIWQKRAERARTIAEEVQDRAPNATHIRFRRRMLKLASDMSKWPTWPKERKKDFDQR
jgi:hypothetical protein